MTWLIAFGIYPVGISAKVTVVNIQNGMEKSVMEDQLPVELTRTVLQGQDIKEQLPGKYIVFAPNNSAFPVAIDRYVVDDGCFQGYLSNEMMIALPSRAKWVVYNRSLLKTLTVEEATKRAAERTVAQSKIERDIIGMPKDLMDMFGKHETGKEDKEEKAAPTGVYL